MCLFSIGGHTVGPTVLKFGMEDHIYPREVIGYILLRYTGSGEANRSKLLVVCLGLDVAAGQGFAVGWALQRGEALQRA